MRSHKLFELPYLHDDTETLICSHNNLLVLPTLPHGLKYLDCSYNYLHELPTLPDTLKTLICDCNIIKELPELPGSLRVLYCTYNNLQYLPNIPELVNALGCSYNPITALPVLSNNLKSFHCIGTYIHNIVTLPTSLSVCNIEQNNMNILPRFTNITNMTLYAKNNPALIQFPTHNDDNTISLGKQYGAAWNIYHDAINTEHLYEAIM